MMRRLAPLFFFFPFLIIGAILLSGILVIEPKDPDCPVPLAVESDLKNPETLGMIEYMCGVLCPKIKSD